MKTKQCFPNWYVLKGPNTPKNGVYTLLNKKPIGTKNIIAIQFYGIQRYNAATKEINIAIFLYLFSVAAVWHGTRKRRQFTTLVSYVKSVFKCIRNMFFLFDSLLANKGLWMWHKKNNQKIEKCNFSDFTRDILIIFLQDRFYPDVEFYGWKDSSGKHISNG